MLKSDASSTCLQQQRLHGAWCVVYKGDRLTKLAELDARDLIATLLYSQQVL